MFLDVDKFYGVVIGVRGSSGMEMKIIVIGKYFRIEMLKVRSYCG